MSINEELIPRKIVEKLDKYIVGQYQAKKSVAIALRNRMRRKLVEADLKDEILPKNILMIGPTGVGKTEIARRLAKIVAAPFIKIEVTKFTEVGYVGRDVESMVRDLVESAIRLIKEERMSEVNEKASQRAIQRIVDILLPLPGKKSNNSFNFFLDDDATNKEEDNSASYDRIKARRKRLQDKITAGEVDAKTIEIEVDANNPKMMDFLSGSGMEEMGIDFQDMFGSFMPTKKKKRKVSIAEAKTILQQQEAQKMVDMDEVASLAIEKVEENGIIFLDEIDKIAGRESGSGPEVSREGVQRDILPIVEGSTVMTKHGPVKSDHILFIAAGAFHVSSPADLIPELQGRFPIRVELDNLSVGNFKEILLKPQNSLTRQYKALLQTENIEIEFTEEAIEEIAELAFEVNEETENIGARRLQTIMEKLLEDLLFEAPELEEHNFIIDVNYVKDKLADVVKNKDLSKYIL